MSKYNSYEKDGQLYVAVTSCLASLFDKPELYYWFKKIPATKAVDLCLENADIKTNREAIIAEAIRECDRIRDEAADVGSRGHQFIQAMLTGHPVELSNLEADIRPRIELWLEWYKGHTLEPKDVEIELYSKLGFAGTGDFFGKLDGKFYYLDWKFTSTANTDIMPLQNGAYVMAYEEVTGQKVEGMGTLHIGPESVKLHDHSDVIEESKAAFIAGLHLWRWRNRNSKKWKHIIKGE